MELSPNKKYILKRIVAFLVFVVCVIIIIVIVNSPLTAIDSSGDGMRSNTQSLILGVALFGIFGSLFGYAIIEKPTTVDKTIEYRDYPENDQRFNINH